jgi:hypothetical protein
MYVTIHTINLIVSKGLLHNHNKDKNMLKRRKESGTYLATDSRHHWSRQMTTKNDNSFSADEGRSAG